MRPGTRKLAKVLGRKTRKGKGPLGTPEAAWGRVVSLQQGSNVDTLTLQIGGAGGNLVAGVEHLDSYNPMVGHQVRYDVQHGVPHVVGHLGPFAPYPPTSTPYTPPPAVPTVDVAFYVCAASNGGTVQINAFTAAGAFVAAASPGLYEVTPENRAACRWSHLAPGQGLLGVVGSTTSGGSTWKALIYQIGAYGYPGLNPLATIDLTGSTETSASCVWDPATPILYVLFDGAINGYAPDGTLVVGPITVSDTITGTPYTIISATADGYVFVCDNEGDVGVWETESLGAIGSASTGSNDVSFVAQGDGSVDVVGGPTGFVNPGDLWVVEPGGPSLAEVTGGGDLGQPMMPGCLNSILFLSAEENEFTGWNMAGTPAPLTTFSLLVGPLTHIYALCVAPDGVTCLALGKDGDDNLYVLPFYSDGSVGTPVELTGDWAFPFTGAYDTLQFHCSPYSHPAPGIETE